MPKKSKLTSMLAFLAGLAVVAACGAPGGTAATTSADASEKISEPVTAAQIADLGDITLKVWADAGEEATLNRLVPLYEEAYPNVKVDVTFKGWDDLMGTVVNALNSDDPPDVTNGNQGYAIMGTMVAGGLLRPLDDI